MKKYDFWPSRPPLKSAVEGKKKQTFCKKAQWRAKKLRERGSNTARPTEKGGGGLPIGSRRSMPIGSRRSMPIGSRRSMPIGSRRSMPIGSCRHTSQDTKKPDSSIGESGFSYRKASRALNLLLAPLSNTRASVRSVLLGLARRFCIVMPTSDRRHIVHCT